MWKVHCDCHETEGLHHGAGGQHGLGFMLLLDLTTAFKVAVRLA